MSEQMTIREALDLAWANHRHRRYDYTVEICRRVLAAQPRNIRAMHILALGLEATGQIGLAAEQLQQAIALAPGDHEMRTNLGKMLHLLGRVGEAVDVTRSALEIKPDYSIAHSNLLYMMLFDPRFDAEAVYRERLCWASVQAAALPMRRTFANLRDPERKLRIGYISPFFRAHAVNVFIEPILFSHDRRQFEIFCYSDVLEQDPATMRLRAVAQWRQINAQSDHAVAELIERDAIDLLIDLSGHMGRGRLLVFARKPAPVQVSYIGDQATTGLSAMDWRLTDAVADPPGSEAHYVERLCRLPRAFFVYQPWVLAPEVAPPPHVQAGSITFGSFNHTAKISDQCVRVWTQLLHAMPASRLLMLVHDAHAVGARLRAAFEARGVGSTRIEFAPRNLTPPQYLKMYQRIDVALDPFPFGGHTTTCDALWMGVPVVTLRGRSYAGRMSASVLHHVGLDELIAEDVDAYIATAATIASSPGRLLELRWRLRAIMSPILDAQRFTRELERAYRAMWREYCVSATA